MKKVSSLDLITQISVTSYSQMIGRVNAMDNRLHALITLSCAISVAIPILSKNTEILWESDICLIFAASLFALTFMTGFFGLAFLNKLIVLDPAKLVDEYIDLSTDDAKRYLCEYAGENFKKNKKLVIGKWICANVMCCMIVTEIILIGCWAFISP